MEQIELYSKLTALPLFMGMSQGELEQVTARIDFDIQRATRGETIISEGQKSGQLFLLASGEAEMTIASDDRSYTVTEWVKAPALVQPERSFGLTQRYTCSLKATQPCSIILLNKAETLRLTDVSLVFRLNLLNLLSTSMQKANHNVWRSTPQSLEERICRFFIAHCTHPGGRKLFRIKMTRLAAELNDNRQYISQALNRLQDLHLISLSRGKIEIPSIEHLNGIR